METPPPHWISQPQKASGPLAAPTPGQVTFQPHWSFVQHAALKELEGGEQREEMKKTRRGKYDVGDLTTRALSSVINGQALNYFSLSSHVPSLFYALILTDWFSCGRPRTAPAKASTGKSPPFNIKGQTKTSEITKHTCTRSRVVYSI